MGIQNPGREAKGDQCNEGFIRPMVNKDTPLFSYKMVERQLT